MVNAVNKGEGNTLRRIIVLILSLATALAFMPGSGLFVAEKAHADDGYVELDGTMVNQFEPRGNNLILRGPYTGTATKVKTPLMQGDYNGRNLWIGVVQGSTDFDNYGYNNYTRPFFSDSTITHIKIPEVMIIGIESFAEAEKLEYVEIGACNVTSGSNSSKTVMLQSGAFRDCKNLKEVVFTDEEVNHIVINGFSGCSSLEKVTLPAEINATSNNPSIGAIAFAECTSLSSTTIPDGMKTIGAGAFRNTALAEITIPDSVTSIGANAFGYDYDSTNKEYTKKEGFVIYASEGSAGDTYADVNDFPNMTVINSIITDVEEPLKAVGNPITEEDQEKIEQARAALDAAVGKAEAADEKYGCSPLAVNLISGKMQYLTAAVGEKETAWNSFVAQKQAVKENLGTLIQLAKKYKQNDYTDSSYEDLQAAISNAEAVYNNEDATKAALDEQKTALETAIDNMKEACWVTFDSNGGTPVPKAKVEKGTSVSEPDPSPTKDGQSFVHWYKDGKPYSFGTAVNEDITLVAGWSDTYYSVKFDSDGGTPVDEQSVKYNTKATEPKDPEKAGFDFAGWYDGDTLFEFDKNITQDVELKAKWTVKEYTVTFESNGGSPVESQTIIHGGKVEKPVDPTKKGYTFMEDGWFTDENCKYRYIFSDEVESEFTLYAGWEANKYKVKYDPNGGTGQMGDQDFTYDQQKKLNANAFSKDGHTFQGWNTDSNGNGTSYTNEQEVNNLTAVNNGQVTLYAQWTENNTGGGGNDPGTGGGGNDPGTGGGGNDPGTGGGGNDPGTGGGGNDPGTGGGGNDPGTGGGNVTAVDYTKHTITEIEKIIVQEITPETPSPLAAVNALIVKTNNDKDIKGSTYAPLMVLSKKQTNKSVKVQWKKVKGAKQYTVYGNLCGKGKKYQKIKTVKGTSLNIKKIAGKKVKKGKFYKFIIVAENGDKAVTISKTIHVITKGNKKQANHKKVDVKKAVTKKAKKLKKGKSLSLKAKAVAPKGKKVKNHVKVRYESSNKKIATVNKSGRVKAKKKGSCVIYAYAQNGIATKVKIKVK